jgi:subtilisin family serine protease
MLLALATVATGASGAGAREPRDPSWPFDWAQHRVRMPEVWDYTTGRPDVVIASVDTGVNQDLDDLAGAVVPGWDFTDGDAVTTDTHGHGTLVASEMVGRGDNTRDIAGYCWQCRLMPIRVGASQQTEDSLIAAGIRYAVDRGARIVNVGFVQETGPAPDATLGQAVAYAVSHNVLVVASAGNTSSSDPTYPGAYAGVLAVAGTDEGDRLEDWSTHGGWVSLAAPGCQAVISIFGTWGHLCGSSFTAPVVSAVAALALSLKPELSAEQLRSALVSTAVPVPGIGGGRVDAFAALRSLGAIPSAQPATQVTPPPPPPPPPPSPPPPAPAPATKTISTRMSRTSSGTMRARLRVPVQVGTGRLTVKLSLRTTRGCRLSASSASEVLLTTERRPKILGISARVTAGRYTVAAVCSSRSLKAYRLVISGAAPPTDGDGSARS